MLVNWLMIYTLGAFKPLGLTENETGRATDIVGIDLFVRNKDEKGRKEILFEKNLLLY